MSATLVTRNGDPKALKPLLAAQVSGTKLAVISHSDRPTWLKLTGNEEVESNLFLILPNNSSIITEPNAMARYFLNSTSLSTDSLLEYEERVARSAVYAGMPLDAQIVSRLESYIAAINSIELGFICLAPTLQYAQGLSPSLVEWLHHLIQSDQAIASLFETESDASLFKADVDAYTAAKPKVPIPGKRNILITSALPYVNNVPHLGNIIGCVLSADVYARFCRARGYNTIYVCGTDEYGTATETKALEEGLSCQEICDNYHAVHAGIYKWFDIEFDKFGRTPTRAQTEIGQEIFKTLDERGFLQEQTIEQLYSEPLGKFLADRFVIGTCPKCRYEDARGDQCDACGSLLNPIELINPKCKLTGSTPVVKQTRHVFLDLPKIESDLRKYIDETSKSGGWTSNCVQTTNAWLTNGLKPRCITRDLKWGTPVPKEGFRDKVFYVWFDAPIGYISITANYCHDWKAWWMNPDNVEMVQFMGKDNVPFHTVIFPSTLLGTGQPWTMMKSISVTEYLNYEDGKFSKSRCLGVFGNDAQETGIPSEVWRYYLLAVRPEAQDSAFQWDDFAAKNNNELNDNVGNFINRTVKFIWARYDKAIPGPRGTAGAAAVAGLGEQVSSLLDQYIQALEAIKLKEGLRIAMNISRAGNVFFQDTEIWAKYKTDPDTAATYISACAGVVLLIAIVFRPYMPSFSDNLLAQLNIKGEEMPGIDDALVTAARNPAALLSAGHQLSEIEPKPLFRKIQDEEVASLRVRYSGCQGDRVEGADGTVNKQQQSVPPVAAATGMKKDNGAVVKEVVKEAKKPNAAAAAAGKDKDKDRAVDLSRVDLRVGVITKAWRHPDAESLYVEEVDVGETEPRTVVSGLVKYIPEAEMQNRRVVLVCNLKPANMRGIKSAAMVLAATSVDGSTVELVEPPSAAAVGERVTAEGYTAEPDEQLHPKKKIWESVQPDLATNSDAMACYKGLPLKTSAGPCTVKSVRGATIK